MNIIHRIKEVLIRHDSPSMRRDLARWYDVDISLVDIIADEIEREKNERNRI
jgi:hypothetical protein